jgi:CheY-like chemotaxis protein/HPt (histidine-containing phosphotransfer) domain-containing protein
MTGRAGSWRGSTPPRGTSTASSASCSRRSLRRIGVEACPTSDVARLLRHLGRRWTGEASERGVRFGIDADDDLPAALRVDVTALARAIGNLVSSALTYAWPGEVRLGVRRTPEGGIAIVVADDGVGLAPETLDAVLADAAPIDARVGASVDSLRIARGLAAEIGGEFGLAHRSEGGLEARLTFAPELCAAPAAAPADGPVTAADLTGLRVLLAEDNPSSRFVTTQMLRAQGAVVSVATDGAEALDVFEKRAFDLVLIDIEMPRVGGLEVIRAVRARGDGREDVRIVGLSAAVGREERERILAAGADGLIAKPVTSAEALGAAVRARMADVEPAEAREEVAPAPADLVADLAVFEALHAAIGPEMMDELLEKVVSDLADARRDLEGVLGSLDRRTIRGVSHILISVAGAVGATRLQACARRLNLAAHDDGAADLRPELRRCVLEIDSALDFVNGRAGRLPGTGGCRLRFSSSRTRPRFRCSTRRC